MALDKSYWQSLATDYQTGYLQAFGAPGTENAIVIAMSCAEHETNNGRAWPGTNNFGAVQLRRLTLQEQADFKTGKLKEGDYTASRDGVLHVDTHPTVTTDPVTGVKKSVSIKYPVWFAAFDTRVKGVAYFLRTLARLSSSAFDLPGATCADVAKAMYLHGYYEGAHGGARPIGKRTDPLLPCEAANVADYGAAMQRCRLMIEPQLGGMVGWSAGPPEAGHEGGEAGADETDPTAASPELLAHVQSDVTRPAAKAAPSPWGAILSWLASLFR